MGDAGDTSPRPVYGSGEEFPSPDPFSPATAGLAGKAAPCTSSRSMGFGENKPLGAHGCWGGSCEAGRSLEGVQRDGGSVQRGHPSWLL